MFRNREEEAQLKAGRKRWRKSEREGDLFSEKQELRFSCQDFIILA